MNNQFAPVIALDQARSLVPDKKAFYEALIRNQVVLPPLSDSIVTTAFLLGVYESRLWCPKSDIIKHRLCCDPPGKKDLAELLYDQM